MADDAVVKIGHVQRAIRPELEIYWAKPRVRGLEKIRGLAPFRATAVIRDFIAVDPAGHYVAHQNISAKLRRPPRVINQSDPANGGGTVRVRNRGRCKTQTVVRFAKARIITAANELIDRRTVTVGRVKIAARIQMHAEGIHLPPCELLHARAVRPNAVGVAGLQLDVAAITPTHRGLVVKPVRDVQPAIKSPRKARVHAVRVALVAEGAVQFLTPIRTSVTIGVTQKPDIRNAPDDRAIAIRIHAGRDV